MTKTEGRSIPIHVARIAHTRSRLWERYKIKIKWDELVSLGYFLRYRAMKTEPPEISQTTLPGKKIKVRALKVPYSAGYGNSTFIIEFDGTQTLIVYSPETNCVVTALPVEALNNIIAGLHLNHS